MYDLIRTKNVTVDSTNEAPRTVHQKTVHFTLGVRAGTIFSILMKRIFSPSPNWSGFSKIYLVLVRVCPRCPKIFRSWSGLVLDFSKFPGPGPSRSLISQIFPVLVRFGPGFLKIFRSWSESVLDFSKCLVLVRSGPEFLKNFWSWSGLVLEPDRTAWSWTSRF